MSMINALESHVLADYFNHQGSTVRYLLRRANLTQRAAAVALEIDPRTMRGYCAGEKVPRVVMLALERLVDLARQTGGT